MWLIAVLAVLCLKTKAAKDFVEVSVCPPGPSEWQIQEQAKQCQDPTPDYLCAAVEHKLGHYGEICTKLGLSPSGTCAVLNNATYNLDSVPCKAPAGCPDTAYSPRDLYKWPVCYGDFYGIDRTVTTKGTQVFENTSKIITVTSKPADSGHSSGIVVFVIMVIALILSAALVTVYMHRRRNKSKEIRGAGMDRNEQVENLIQDVEYLEPSPRRTPNSKGMEKNPKKTNTDEKHELRMLNILKQYLVVFLRQHCGIEELKETKVLYNSSLVQHFKEDQLKPMFELSSNDDYQKLDICLVYNLLRNVCKHIKPPTKGWEYEPAIEDATLGADIERIRLLWNKYCDDKEEFEHLHDIFRRMQKKFGDISGNVVGFDKTECNKLEEKEKIKSVEFKPECYVEDGIVLRKGINDALERLNKENFVIVKGVIGCGKSTCLKYIDKYYKRKQWEVKWREEVITRRDFHVKENKKILLCCDNLFGAFNRGHFAASSDIIEAVENHEKDGNGELNVVLAIHDHIFDELEEGQKIKAFQNKNFIIDLNKISAAENLLIFERQRSQGHCKIDPSCWFLGVNFESLYATLRENPGLIGDPLLIMLYSNHHDIFTKKEDTLYIMKTLCAVFQSTLKNHPMLFNALVYVMCVKSHNISSAVSEWATGELGGLNYGQLRLHIPHLNAFLESKGGIIRMKHDILNIALFKVCTGDPRYLPVLLKHCCFEMIDQMMRPDSTVKNDFCVCLNKENVETLVSIMEERKLIVNMTDHPLLKNVKPKSLSKLKGSLKKKKPMTKQNKRKNSLT